MSASYEDYEREYQACLSRIRSHLASSGSSSRTRPMLEECDRLLNEAKKYATAMQGMAEVSNNALYLQTARALIDRDIGPLAKEIRRSLEEMDRSDLFGNQTSQRQGNNGMAFSGGGMGGYMAPDIEHQSHQTHSIDSIIMTSEDLLRDSQALLAETEHIGTLTLQQMGRQREQIQNSNNSLSTLQSATYNASIIMKSMAKKAFKNKVCLYIMISVLLFTNGFVLYCIYKKNHRKLSNSNP